MVNLKHGKVVGEDGFLIPAEAIAEEIKNRVNNKDEFLKGVEKWILGKSGQRKVMGVSGLPKFDLPNVDFGWRKARKLEVISMLRPADLSHNSSLSVRCNGITKDTVVSAPTFADVVFDFLNGKNHG